MTDTSQQKRAAQQPRRSKLSTPELIRCELRRLYIRARNGAIQPDGTLSVQSAEALSKILDRIERSIADHELATRLDEVERELKVSNKKHLSEVK